MDKIIENQLTSIKKNLQRYLNYTCKNLNIKSSESIFLRILDNCGELTQIEISKKLDCDKAHVHRTANKLLEKNLICICDKKEGSRNNLLKITNQGKLIIKKVNKSMQTWIDNIKIGITDSQLNIFKDVVKKITENTNKLNTEIGND